MSKFKIFLISIGSFFCITLLFLFSLIIFILSPTRGEPIKHYTTPSKALLIIDVQEDYTGKTAKPPFPYPESEKVIAAINDIAVTAQNKGMKIVYIRQEYSNKFVILLSRLFSNATAIKGNPGTNIDSRVKILSNAQFPKSIGDAFSNREFNKYLIDNSINELYLTGLDAQYCVHLTAKGALNRGYRVSIISDAILLSSMRKWDNLMDTFSKEGIKIINGKDM